MNRNRAPLVFASLASLLVVACFHINPHAPAPAAQASLKQLKQRGAPKLAVGTVQAVGNAASSDSGIGCRAILRVKPPEETPTFSAYVRQALITELTAAGMYDANSKVVISADLSHVDFNSTGDGEVEMNVAFTVRGGASPVHIDRQLKDKFDAGFFAYSACANTAEAFPKLLEQVISGFLASQPLALSLAPSPSAAASAPPAASAAPPTDPAKKK